MDIAQPPPQPPRYLAGIGISLAVHLLLIVLWQASRPVLSPSDAPREMQFLQVLPLPDVLRTPTPVPARPSAAPAPARRAGGQQPQQAAAPADVSAPAAPSAAESTDTPVPAPSPAPSLLEQARLAAGGIDRALRKENPRRGIQAPIVTAQMRLERGIARAAEVVPNKWYQAPKVDEVIDPGGYGRRRHRVRTALGTYCVTYESNHAPDGIDTMQRGIQPKKTNCDDDEEPAAAQDWNYKAPGSR